jgi:RHS repeat-associated protein
VDQHGERRYDPTIGRFTQQDPLVSLVEPMVWNRYVYVGDNPVNYIDPTGTGFWSCVGGIIGGV